MDKLKIEIKSLLKLKLDLQSWPELHSANKTVEKALELARKGFPRILKAIAKQKAISELQHYEIELLVRDEEASEDKVRHILKLWLQRKKYRRLFYVIVELILMPIAGLMALLPGPNVFFYFLFVFFFFHFKSFVHLNRLDFRKLKLTIVRLPDPGRRE